MIFYSLSQFGSLFALVFASIVFALLFSVIKILFAYNFCNIIFKNIILFLTSILGGIIFILCVNIYCYGEFNFVFAIIYLLTFKTCVNLLKKIVDFLALKVYYIYKKIFRLGRNKIARKLCSIKD